MQYEQLAWIHLVTILPAFLVGTWMMVRRKGTRNHRMLGKVYMVVVFFSAALTLLMSARIGPTLFGHFGFIHILSAWTMFAIVIAWRAVQAKDITRHKGAMIGVYVGGMLIAGSFAFMPGRMLHELIFGS